MAGEVGEADKIFFESNHLEINIKFEVQTLKDSLICDIRAFDFSNRESTCVLTTSIGQFQLNF